MDELLAVEAVDVTKTFGSLRAVDSVSVQVSPGEVYGVLGPNGAGKTTFLCASGSAWPPACSATLG